MSTNLPPTAYIKMIDCWLIFSLLKPFVDIILQTYIQTLRDTSGQAWTGKEAERRIKFCRKILRIIYPSVFISFITTFWLTGALHYLTV